MKHGRVGRWLPLFMSPEIRCLPHGLADLGAGGGTCVSEASVQCRATKLLHWVPKPLVLNTALLILNTNSSQNTNYQHHIFNYQHHQSQTVNYQHTVLIINTVNLKSLIINTLQSQNLNYQHPLLIINTPSIQTLNYQHHIVNYQHHSVNSQHHSGVERKK